MKNNKLNLWGKEILDIAEIKGLDLLVDLQELDLANNKLTEIKGFDQLVNLQKLDLSLNKITEIKGLDQLVNLRELDLVGNPVKELKGLGNLTNLQKLKLSNTLVPKELISELGGMESILQDYKMRDPRAVVNYCKTHKSLEQKKKARQGNRLDQIVMPAGKSETNIAETEHLRSLLRAIDGMKARLEEEIAKNAEWSYFARSDGMFTKVDDDSQSTRSIITQLLIKRDQLNTSCVPIPSNIDMLVV